MDLSASAAALFGAGQPGWRDEARFVMRDTQQYPSQPGHVSIWTSRFREASLASLRRRSCIRRRIRPPKIMTRIPAPTEPIVMPVVCPDVSRFASVWCSTLVTRRRAASRGAGCGIDRCMPFTASFGRPGTIIAREVSVWTGAHTRYPDLLCCEKD